MALLIFVAAVFGILRFLLPVAGKVNRADIYKDLAHIFVGFLLGYGFADHAGWWLAGALTVLEVVAFIVRKKP